MNSFIKGSAEKCYYFPKFLQSNTNKMTVLKVQQENTLILQIYFC